MAEPEVRISSGNLEEAEDVTMEGDDVVEVEETGAADAQGEDIEEFEDEKPAESRVTFVEFAPQHPIICPPPSLPR